MRRETLTAQTADTVVQLVRDGNLRAGDRLPPLNEIAASLGVSMTVAREAVAELAAQGLIVRKQGSGNVLALPGSHNLARLLEMRSIVGGLQARQLQEYRFAVETAVARLAAVRADDSGIERLNEHLRALEAATSPDSLHEADVRFHACIAQLSGNELLAISIEAVEPLLRELRQRTWEGWGVRGKAREEGIRQHERIRDAIAARSPDDAAAAMSDHLISASESLEALSSSA